MIWKSNTCFCEILTVAPSKSGVFIKPPCEVHKNSTDTREVNDFNLLHRRKNLESEGQSDLRKLTLQLTTKRKL